MSSLSSPSSGRAAEPIQAPARARLHLLYHELSSAPTDYTYALPLAEFRDHIEVIRRARASEDSWLWPEITFDDGHVSNVEFALPELSAAGLAARFFITAGWTSQRPGYMSWEQLRDLHRAGQHIGAHGWSHKLLTHCSEAELDTELRSARLLLEDKLETPITTMSLPGGRHNPRVLDACERAGYTQIFTSVPRAESSPDARLVGRLNLRAGSSPSWLESVLQPETGALARLERQQRMKELAQRLLGDWLYLKLWAQLNRHNAAPQATA